MAPLRLSRKQKGCRFGCRNNSRNNCRIEPDQVWMPIRGIRDRDWSRPALFRLDFYFRKAPHERRRLFTFRNSLGLGNSAHR